VKEFSARKEDTQLRREAFEAYARACACSEMRGDGREYAQKALALLSAISEPDAGDRELMENIEGLF